MRVVGWKRRWKTECSLKKGELEKRLNVIPHQEKDMGCSLRKVACNK